MRALALIILAGCWRGATSDRPAISNAGGTEIVMSEEGVGPFGAGTVANLDGVVRAAPGYTVTSRDADDDAGATFDVAMGGERIFYVVPDDAPGWEDEGGASHHYATTMFAVFAVSPSVRVQGRSWRVGAPLSSTTGLERCECWGSGEVTACFAARRHVRLVFEQPCEVAAVAGPRAMIGKPIGRLMWKRELDPPTDAPQGN